MCPNCQSLDWDAVEASGRGTVFSFVMPHHPLFPVFDYPYVVALVDLEEGMRLVSNLCDIDPADVTVGMPVMVCFETFDDEIVLHQFRADDKTVMRLPNPHHELQWRAIEVGDEVTPLDIPSPRP